MDWNFTLRATASGLINGVLPFVDAAITIELSACRFPADTGGNRQYAIFNGSGIVVLGEQRFAFDPNRYGLLIECERRAYGEWLSIAFGSVDAPLMLAGFDLPKWNGLQAGCELHAAPDSGMNCRAKLEALASDTLDMVTLQLERGSTTPSLHLRRAA
jgi:hypothetical protein